MTKDTKTKPFQADINYLRTLIDMLEEGQPDEESEAYTAFATAMAVARGAMLAATGATGCLVGDWCERLHPDAPLARRVKA